MRRMRLTFPTAAVTAAAKTAAEVTASGHTTEYKQGLSKDKKNKIYERPACYIHTFGVWNCVRVC